jgi:hypothetical protein
MTAPAPPFTELIAATTTSAVHLEMRDAYTPSDPGFLAWLAGTPITAILASPQDDWWYQLVQGHVLRGVTFRRARIVSEPLADYIRYEHASTPILNIAAGEQVRWLPRRRASDLCLPGNDFWVFDGRLVRFGHFAGDGEILDQEMCDDPAVVRLCSSAFEAVWERATDHARYHPAR